MALAFGAAAFAQPGGREVGENVPGAGRRFIPDPDPEFVVLNRRGNSYLNAWNAYEQMNGMTVNREMDFSIDPVFGQQLRDRESIRTVKGEGIVMETGQLYKGEVPMIKMVAVINYGHWNFMPTAQVMWDFFKQFRRDPETKKLIYVGR